MRPRHVERVSKNIVVEVYGGWNEIAVTALRSWIGVWTRSWCSIRA